MPGQDEQNPSDKTPELDDGYEPVSLDDAAPLSEDADVIGEAELIEPPTPGAPPKRREGFSLPELEGLTAQDREFVQRVFTQVRDVDFRSPPPPPPKRDLAGPDKKIALLRQRVHELERDLARVGFVWGALQAQYDNVEKIVAAKESERQTAVDRHNLLKDQATRAAQQHKMESDVQKRAISDLTANRDALTAELSKTRDAAAKKAAEDEARFQKSEQEKAALAADFRAKMEMAQNAFNQLRDQSTRAVSELEARLRKSEEEYTAKAQELLTAQAVGEDQKARIDELQKSVADREQKLTQAGEERERLVGRLAERDKAFNTLTEELAKLRVEQEQHVAELRASIKTRDELLDATRNEVSSARSEFRQIAEQQEAMKRELAARDQELATLRKDYDAVKEQAQKLEQDVQTRDGELASAKGALDAAREETRIAREDAERIGARLAEAQSTPASGSATPGVGTKSESGEGKAV